MTMQSRNNELFAGIDELIDAGQYDAASERLAEIHIAHHAAALIHLRVHMWSMRMARRQRDVYRMVGQILPIVFAIPTSWVQRNLGLALPSRLRKTDC